MSDANVGENCDAAKSAAGCGAIFDAAWVVHAGVLGVAAGECGDRWCGVAGRSVTAIGVWVGLVGVARADGHDVVAAEPVEDSSEFRRSALLDTAGGGARGDCAARRSGGEYSVA